MRVHISGKIKILNVDTREEIEIHNIVDTITLASEIIRILNNNFPSSSVGASVIFVNNNVVSITATIGSNTISWSGTLKLTVGMTVAQLILQPAIYAFGNVQYAILSYVDNLSIQLPPGTYTITWTWTVNDNVGMLWFILSNMFVNGNINSISYSVANATRVWVVNTYNVITWFILFYPSSQTTISSVTITISITNSSNATTTNNYTFNVTSETISANEPYALPISLIIV